MPSTCFNELLDVMREIIDTGGEDFLPFKGFFFDTWAAGIKEPLVEGWRIALLMSIEALSIIAMDLWILHVKKSHQLLLLAFHAKIHYKL